AEYDKEREKLHESLAEVESRFQQTEGVLRNVQESLGSGSTGKIVEGIVSLATGLSGLTQELSLVKARARLEAVTVPKVELGSLRALEIARANRLDWMNNRASLVDTWRLISFNAQQ